MASGERGPSSRSGNRQMYDLDTEPERDVTTIRVLNDIPKEPVVVAAPSVGFNYVDVTFPKPPEDLGNRDGGGVGRREREITNGGGGRREREITKDGGGRREGEITKSGGGRRGDNPISGGGDRMVNYSPKDSTKDSKRAKNYADTSRRRGTSSNRQRNNENEFPGAAQSDEAVGGYNANRQEFLRQLLKKGIPTWEEVPEEERQLRYIGGTNPFRSHPYQSSPLASNITLRNSNKQRSKRTINAVWEDVRGESINTRPTMTQDNVLYDPTAYDDGNTDHQRANINSEECLPASSHIPLNQNLHHHHHHLMPGQPHQSHHLYESDQAEIIQGSPRTTSFITSRVPVDNEGLASTGNNNNKCNETFSVHCSTEDIIEGFEIDPQNAPGSAAMSESNNLVSESGNPGNLTRPERLSRPVMKRKHGGRFDDNDIAASISWRPGDRRYGDRNKVEEEEKHEKESTKEKRSKRDPSTDSQGQTTSPSRPHTFSPTKEGVCEPPPKTPPRVRHYEQTEVKKFMEAKRLERLKTLKENKILKEHEKTKRDERLKELAARTRELARGSKSGVGGRPAEVVVVGATGGRQVTSDGKTCVNWGYSEECELAGPKEGTVSDDYIVTHIPNKPQVNSEAGKADNIVEETLHHGPKCSEEMENPGKEEIMSDGKKREHKRRKSKISLSDSESISSIVSRTVEECEKQVRSSNVSVDSYSSVSSVNTSDSESGQEESLSTSLDLAPKDRVLALSRMALRLTDSLKKEERHLRQQQKQQQQHHGRQNVENTRPLKEIKSADSASLELHDRERNIHKGEKGAGEAKLHISSAERDSLSVEEIAAKMTALLPKTNGRQGVLRDLAHSNNSNNESYTNDRRQKVINTSKVPLHSSETTSLSVEELADKMKSLLPEIYGNQETGMGREMSKVQIQDGKNKSVRTSKNPDTRTGTQSVVKGAPNNDYPNLIIPDVPDLQVAGGSSSVFGKMDDISNLPGNNNVTHQDFNPLIPSYRDMQYGQYWQGDSIATSSGKQQFRQVENYGVYPRIVDPAVNKAALIIQAAYRGYRVRKITGILLKRHHTKVLIGKHNSTRPGHQNYEHSYRNLGQNFVPRNQEHSLVENVWPREQESVDIDWRQIRAELRGKTLKTTQDSKENIQKSDLPDWIKPYVILSETGDVEGFVESRVNMLPPRQVRKERNMASQRGTPDREEVNVRDTQDLTEGITEGPLEELTESGVEMYEKETQTSNLETRPGKSNPTRGKTEEPPKHARNHGDKEFFDLRKKFKGEKRLALQASEDVLKKSKVETKPTVQGSEKIHTSETTETTAPSPDISSLDYTLEEGPLQDTIDTSSFQQSVADTTDFEEGLLVESSGVLESSNVNDSANTLEESAPHKLLGSGLHLGPASLRLRLNAELLYQDTLGEALNQLTNVSHIDVVTKTQQDTVALSHTLNTQQQQNLEYMAQEEKLKEEKRQKEEKAMKEHDRRMRDEIRQHHEVLRNIEKMEMEAKERVVALERELLAKAEQVLSKAVENKPENNTTQSDVIAAAAVAAVGATIIQWERLRPVQRSSHSEQVNSTSSSSSSSQHTSSLHQHTNDSTLHSQILGSVHSKKSVNGSEGGYTTENSVSFVSKRPLVHVNTNPRLGEKKISNTQLDVSQQSVSESIRNEEDSNSTLKKNTPTTSFVSPSVSEHLPSNVNPGRRNKASTPSISSVVEDIEGSQSEVVAEEIVDGGGVGVGGKISDGESSRLSESVQESLDVGKDTVSIAESINTGKLTSTGYTQPASGSIATEYSKPTNGSVVTEYSVPTSGSIATEYSKSSSGLVATEYSVPTSGSIATEYSKASSGSVATEYSKPSTSGHRSSTISSALPTSASSQTHSLVTSSAKQSFHRVSRPHSKKLKMYQHKDQGGMRKAHSSPSIHTSSPSKSDTTSTNNNNNKKTKNRHDASDAYSESFEVESGSESTTTTTSTSHSQDIPSQGGHRGELSLVVSLGKGPPTVPRDTHSALGMTLGLVESLQKEEEVRHKHQMALLKVQEQSLIEEARWRLSELQSEGGPGLRKRQRAVLLQLREQRAHLKRLIETQNIATQQRRIMLLQHHHLLATTTPMSAAVTRSHFASSWGHSPGPSSPRLTPRMMELGASSSSDAQEDISLSYLLRGRDTGSSSPSDGGVGGAHEKRSHSEERLRMSSFRLQDKRRAAEAENVERLLLEDKEVLKLKGKSSYDNLDKESVMSKRKDYISKRSRDKRDRSPGSGSPLLLPQNTKNLVDSSVHEEESFDVPEEDGGSETLSHSDIASSISEQEGLTSSIHTALTSKETTYSKKSSSIDNTQSKGDLNNTQSSNIKMAKVVTKQLKPVQEKGGDKEFKTSDGSANSSIRTQLSDESKSRSIKEQRVSSGTDKSSTVHTDSSEKISEALDLAVGTNSYLSSSENSQNKSVKLGSTATDEGKVRMSPGSSRSVAETSSVIEMKFSNSICSEGKSSSQKMSSSKCMPLPLRVPLSPRSPHRHHRRYSSESDDSFTLSQTETASDISDGEGKLLALKEQLAVRRAEAERLKKEKKRIRRERLTSQERALRQQISTYDTYIQQARMELEKESKELQQASLVKPLIKKPQVAETKKSRLSDVATVSPEKSEVSDLSAISESSKSDQSTLSKAQETSADELAPGIPESESVKVDMKDVPNRKEIINDKQFDGIHKEATHIAEQSKEEMYASATSANSSISEEYSFEEESVSESVHDKSSARVSSSQESSADTDHSPSRASSTETIVHSPKKVSLSLHEQEPSIHTPADPTQAEDKDDGSQVSENEMVIHEGTSVQKDSQSVFQNEEEMKLKDEAVVVGEDITEGDSLHDSKMVLDANVLAVEGKVDTKLDIFMPVVGDDETTEKKDISTKESISEEIAEDVEDVSGNENCEPSKISLRSAKENSLENEADTTQSLSLSFDKDVPLKVSVYAVQGREDTGGDIQPATTVKVCDEKIDDDVLQDQEASENHQTLGETDVNVVVSESSQDEDRKTDDNVKLDRKTDDNVKLVRKTDENVKLDRKTDDNVKLDRKTDDNVKLDRKTDDNVKLDRKTDDNVKLDRKTDENVKLDRKTDENVKLDKQRLVDEVSNNLLVSMLKDTSELFLHLMKTKAKSAEESKQDSRHISSSTPTPGENIRELQTKETIEHEESSGEESESIPIPLENLVHSKETDKLHSYPSNTDSKSKRPQETGEIIGDTDRSPTNSTSCLLPPTPADFHLDLTPHGASTTAPLAGAKETAAQKPTSTEEGQEEAKGPSTPGDTPSQAIVSCTSTSTLTDVIPPSGEIVPVPVSTTTRLDVDNEAVSPSHDISQADNYSLDMKALTSKLLDLTASSELDLDSKLDQLGESSEFSVEGIEGDWFDDDFWTSADSKKKQQQLKAEEERIAAEIARLEELQHLQEQYPGLVFREVPKHPPPPYSSTPTTSPTTTSSSTKTNPPAYSLATSELSPSVQLPHTPEHSSTSHRLSKADQRKLESHVNQVVPFSQEEALPIVHEALACLYEAWEKRMDPSLVEPPPNLVPPSPTSESEQEQVLDDEEVSGRAFHLLLFSLARELVAKPYAVQTAPPPPPWVKRTFSRSGVLYGRYTRSRDTLFSHVKEQVGNLCGWRKPLEKESLMVRWAQKHRDRVDQVLVKELQTEETNWTNYDEDEAAVKTQVAEDILDAIISETATLFASIIAKKISYVR
ncbi:hypothetical protein Pmani_026783 [Petrolisthes manimaculis]|uniref:Uncharacterized protein n=1 Tax=Petrolisthes manimaculis TaxID=1843537 RepID=A0AAE1P559_9EUCA|nr:hypothetical protein Pmani_026783 [Petrolisthes manimaculis]